MTSPTPTVVVGKVLGFLGYAKLSVFAAQAADAQAAPDLANRLGLSARAKVQIDRVERIGGLLGELNIDPVPAMAEFADVLAAFERAPVPADWWEAVIKTYIFHGMSADLERFLVDGLGPEWSTRLAPVMSQGASAEYVASVVAAAVAADDRWASRLSLWGRRVVGEVLHIAQRLFVEHPEFVALLPPAGHEGQDPVARAHGQLTAQHARRMGALGLTA